MAVEVASDSENSVPDLVKEVLRDNPPDTWMSNREIRDIAENSDSGPYSCRRPLTAANVSYAIRVIPQDELEVEFEGRQAGMGHRREIRRLALESGVPVDTTDSVTPDDSTQDEGADTIHERDLHSFLVHYASELLDCRCLTIRHEEAHHGRRTEDGSWLFPDIVGIEEPFQFEVVGGMAVDEFIATISFEMKWEIGVNTWRKPFFQTVANSSWAHSSFLVVARMQQEPHFQRMMYKMCKTHGIGIIVLFNEQGQFDLNTGPFYRPERSDMDWATIDLIAARHQGFFDFIDEYTTLGEQQLDDLRWNEIYDEVVNIDELHREGTRIYRGKFPEV